MRTMWFFLVAGWVLIGFGIPVEGLQGIALGASGAVCTTIAAVIGFRMMKRGKR